METNEEYQLKIKKIAAKSNYHEELFYVVFAGLDEARKKYKTPTHITGQELCEGIKIFVKKTYGVMGRHILETWGAKTTRDFGEIIYLMIENNLMGKSNSDSLNDFNDVYGFATFDIMEVTEKIDWKL